jgi:protoporphyrinogen oxidase
MSAAAEPTVIIGAGPAGLTAAYELARHGLPVTVLEQSRSEVGGIARTVDYKGFRFDIGGHRFFSKSREIEQLWTDLLGPRLRTCGRLSRIHYRGRLFKYPLEPVNALAQLGVPDAVRCLASYLWAQAVPPREVKSFEDWVVSAFGRRFYEIFFKTYTEKVWGIPCSEISADWAAQRIRGLSVPSLIRAALFRQSSNNGAVVKTLIDEFRYPTLGPGELWQEVAQRVRAHGGTICFDHRVTRIEHADGRVHTVTADTPDGPRHYEAAHLISTMPIAELIAALDPEVPPPVRAAASGLRYRDFLVVGLILEQAAVFPDNWIYIHDPGVRVGRVQNFKNWSAQMVPDARFTALGAEYFCHEGDALWHAADADLIRLAADELGALGLIDPARVRDGTVVRQPKAYPVYDHAYRSHVAAVRGYLHEQAINLQLVGRNGMHKYNNQDHAMMTGLMAARNIQGAAFDLWRVNADAEYLEEEADEEARVTPSRLGDVPVWGIPALDVMSVQKGYAGGIGLPLAAELACFALLHELGGLEYVTAFAVGSVVGAVAHQARYVAPRELWRRAPAIGRDALNSFLVNLAPLVIFAEWLGGRATLARGLTALTVAALRFVRQNVVARWRQRMIEDSERRYSP